MADQVSVTREVAAPPQRVYELVSDVTQMGRWSPETESCEWLGDPRGPEVGARFRGRNALGSKRWATVSTVVAAEPGRRFAFETKGGPFKVARWEYRIEPTEDGCRVTETWTDQRGRVITVLGKRVSGVDDRATHNRTGMEQTLERLAEAAETATR